MGNPPSVKNKLVRNALFRKEKIKKLKEKKDRKKKRQAEGKVRSMQCRREYGIINPK